MCPLYCKYITIWRLSHILDTLMMTNIAASLDQSGTMLLYCVPHLLINCRVGGLYCTSQC